MIAAVAAVASLALGSVGAAPQPAPPPLRPALAPCTAKAPEPGVSFTGTVLQVIDGRTLCVAQGPTPDQWVRVRLADGGAASRGALLAAAFAHEVECVSTGRDAVGVSGVCILGGASLSGLARAPVAEAQAADWR